MNNNNIKFKFYIDRGGSFTDIFCKYYNNDNNTNNELQLKLLSVDKNHYEDAPREGIRRIISNILNINIKRNELIPINNIEQIRMSTTVATNALLERKGSKFCFITTKGFKDILKINNQSRADIFDLEAKKPSVLYSNVIEIDERIMLKNSYKANGKTPINNNPSNLTKTLEPIDIIKKPNENEIKKKLQKLLDSNIKSIAICFLHSSIYPNHEIIVKNIAKKMGFTNIILSSEASSMIKFVPRGFTATADAYLTPHILEYVNHFIKGFQNKNHLINKVQFMQSDGGLTDLKNFYAHNAIVSGPAGGVVGFSQTTCYKNSQPSIGFDMGGTSTDVSRYDGKYEHVLETIISGVNIQASQLPIETIAAGGGNIYYYI